MIGLQLKITKHEFASREQAKDYRGTYNLDTSVTSRDQMVEASHAPSSTEHYDSDHTDAYWEDDWDDYDDDYDYEYDDYYYDEDWYPDENYDETYYDEYYGGKKGKKSGKHDKSKSSKSPGGKKPGGKQPLGEACTHCGSHWHKTADCPIGDKGNQQHDSNTNSTTNEPSHDTAHWDEYYENYDDYYGKGKGCGKGHFRPREGKGYGQGGPPRFPRRSWSTPRFSKSPGKGGKKGRKGPKRGKYTSKRCGKSHYTDDDYWYEDYHGLDNYLSFPTSANHDLNDQQNDENDGHDSEQHDLTAKTLTFDSQNADSDDEHGKSTPQKSRVSVAESMFGITPTPTPSKTLTLTRNTDVTQDILPRNTDVSQNLSPQTTRHDPQHTPTAMTPTKNTSQHVADSWLGPVETYRSTLRSPTVPTPTQSKSQIPTATCCEKCYLFAVLQCGICQKYFCGKHGIKGPTSTRCSSCFSTPTKEDPAMANARQAIVLLHDIDRLEKEVEKIKHDNKTTPTPPASSTWSPTVLKLADLLDEAAAASSPAPPSSSTSSWQKVSPSVEPTNDAVGKQMLEPAPLEGSTSTSRDAGFNAAAHDDVHDDRTLRDVDTTNDNDNDLFNDDANLHFINHSKQHTFDVFHFVRGKKMHGILIDPGAAKGLVGSDTLHEIIVNVLKPATIHKRATWHKSNNKFTGISADPQLSLGMVQFPIGLKGCKHVEFFCDVIGGASSKCPALMPLISMLNTGCLISCGYFSSGDGVLGMRMQDVSFRTQRLLYTDSGHYLLPIHHFNKPADENPNKITKQDFRKLQKEHSKKARTHHDHRHNLTSPVALHEENDANKEDTHTTVEEHTASQLFH